MDTTSKLTQVMGKSHDEVQALIMAALADPSNEMLEALLERFMYLKLSKPEELEKYKVSLEEMQHQGQLFHLQRYYSKLTSR